MFSDLISHSVYVICCICSSAALLFPQICIDLHIKICLLKRVLPPLTLIHLQLDWVTLWDEKKTQNSPIKIHCCGKDTAIHINYLMWFDWGQHSEAISRKLTRINPMKPRFSSVPLKRSHFPKCFSRIRCQVRARPAKGKDPSIHFQYPLRPGLSVTVVCWSLCQLS